MKYPTTAAITKTSSIFNILFRVFIAFFSLPCYNLNYGYYLITYTNRFEKP